MDPRFVNGNNRNANGYFLTHKRAGTDGAEKEHEVYQAAVKFISDKLKEHKIRSANVLDSLEILESIADEALVVVRDKCKTVRVKDSGSRAYVWLIVVACLSTYHERIRRIREDTEEK